MLSNANSQDSGMWSVGDRILKHDLKGNLHGADLSCDTTASPKLPFRAPWRVGDATVNRGSAG